jgi:DNA-binding beta-propeller fold protein YncE
MQRLNCAVAAPRPRPAAVCLLSVVSPIVPALLAAVLLLLVPAGAGALIIYGSPRALAGAGGCVRDPNEEPATDQVCPGLAAGLAGAQAVAVSPDGGNVYVAGEDSVVALGRDRATGALRPARSPSTNACIGSSASSPCAVKDDALGGADALAVSPDGRFVYVGASDAATVSVFARGRNGVLVSRAQDVGGYFGCVVGVPLADTQRGRCGARVGALNGVDALAISPDGRYLYVVSYGLRAGEDSVVTLQRDPVSGGLRPLTGRRGCVQSLPRSVSTCPALAGLEGASAITISRDGRFVYVASQVSGAVRGFRRNRVTGVLAPLYGTGGCISSGNTPAGDVSCAATVPQLGGARSIALSPDGRELYVAAFDPGAVVALTRDPASGRLAVRPPECLQAEPDARCPVGLTFVRGATALVVVPHGRAVYVSAEGGNSLVELLRDPTDGALTPLSASPTAGDPLSGPVALALSPGGQSIYLVSPLDNGVTALFGP